MIAKDFPLIGGKSFAIILWHPPTRDNSKRRVRDGTEARACGLGCADNSKKRLREPASEGQD